MKIPEHLAFSDLLAQCGAQQQYGVPGTLLVMAAGLLPDLDGITLLFGWRIYRKYHRVVGHGLPMTLLGPFTLAAFGAWGLHLGPLWPLWGWLQLSLVAHLISDVVFYRWPVLLLWPVSSRGWEVGLLLWNDLVPTMLLYVGVVVALIWPAWALPASCIAIGTLAAYLLWRAWKPRPRTGWAGWITGNWALDAAPIWLMLTGDFVTMFMRRL